MENNNVTERKSNKTLIVVGIVLLIIIVVCAITSCVKHDVVQVDDSIKDKITYFSIQFNSYPYETKVEYDFVNKKKTVIYYKSGSWTPNDEEVSYNRFDELREYLVNTVFTNKDNTDNYSFKNGYCVVYAVPEADYIMKVGFDDKGLIQAPNKYWYAYVSENDGKAYWTMGGYDRPSYWKEFLKVLEIDNSILKDVKFDFDKMKY